MAVLIRRLAHLFGAQEEELADAFVGIDLGRKRRGVRKLERDVPFPLRLKRCDIHDDAATGIGGLAEADNEHVPRNTEILHRSPQSKAVRRNDAFVTGFIDKAPFGKALRIDCDAVNVREDFELIRHTSIIAIRRKAIGKHISRAKLLDKGLNHLVLKGLVSNPGVVQNRQNLNS